MEMLPFDYICDTGCTENSKKKQKNFEYNQYPLNSATVYLYMLSMYRYMYIHTYIMAIAPSFFIALLSKNVPIYTTQWKKSHSSWNSGPQWCSHLILGPIQKDCMAVIKDYEYDDGWWLPWVLIHRIRKGCWPNSAGEGLANDSVNVIIKV